jgi:hypothetical protein
MTDKERQQAFIEAYNLLRQQFGYELVAVFGRLEQIGHQLQVEPAIGVQPVANWQPAENGESTDSTE